jgi:hypothetical protein
VHTRRLLVWRQDAGHSAVATDDRASLYTPASEGRTKSYAPFFALLKASRPALTASLT